jgi:hypothetical protein
VLPVLEGGRSELTSMVERLTFRSASAIAAVLTRDQVRCQPCAKAWQGLKVLDDDSVLMAQRVLAADPHRLPLVAQRWEAGRYSDDPAGQLRI